MILKNTLKKIVKSQKTELSLDYGIKRELLNKIDTKIPHAIILAGIRRCGKSTLLKQLMKKTNKCYYFNFEDPRALKFEVNDFEKLDEVFKEENKGCNHYFFDEIQNISNWEIFVRHMLDKKRKFVITGSNASLLSRELGTKLTGRHLRYELFPFSYKEMLKLVKKEPGIKSFETYLNEGGFPEYLRYKKIEILQELFNNIIERDIVVRYNLRDSKLVKEIAIFLLTNIGKEFSYNSLKKMFDLGSTNSITSYVSYFENSYLLFTVPKFDYSLKKQLVNPKKVYSIDTGFSNANSASFSLDKGRVLENIVFLQLRRKNKQIYYFREEKECDFVVKEREKIIEAVQVCYKLDESNKERELAGLFEAMNKFHLKEGLILTYDQIDEFKIKGKKIIVMPTWKWLLE
ncbi:MAG: ATP-binding protein [Nanoarchaeota archaeon]|nr:ATP-binding protein [Nanoarchaeota archaeon]MBU1444706.1 ATP-binding protein [Nanoarchaeota archaeon]MBU2420558.1 ATP-binding protein [Nanoarchaeota archaeon]MBU2475781.1 ATP-binding protein [Nanoarchaeota archaeon]